MKMDGQHASGYLLHGLAPADSQKTQTHLLQPQISTSWTVNEEHYLMSSQHCISYAQTSPYEGWCVDNAATQDTCPMPSSLPTFDNCIHGGSTTTKSTSTMPKDINNFGWVSRNITLWDLDEVDPILCSPLATIQAEEPAGGAQQSSLDDWVPEDIYDMGYQDDNGSWRCSYHSCSSQRVFSRACDLRKHFATHSKTFFCTKPGCPWTLNGNGFATKKDRDRHMRAHNPRLACPHPGCDRTFSRTDNMVTIPPPWANVPSSLRKQWTDHTPEKPLYQASRPPPKHIVPQTLSQEHEEALSRKSESL